MSIAKKILISYLKGIDATIRVLGAYVIGSMLYATIYALCWILSKLPFVAISLDHLAVVLGVALSPFIIRLSILGAGFSIPPILAGKKEPQKNQTT